MNPEQVQAIQGELKRGELDGWLIYDFHATNSIAARFLGFRGPVTRRFFFLIPAKGSPTAFTHNIEKAPSRHLPGEKRYFSSYKTLEMELKNALAGMKRIAMEYSPLGRLPYVAKVDAGTIELIRSFGVEVVSSADLVARFDACLTPPQIVTHREAARHLEEIKNGAFALIREHLSKEKRLTEYDVVRFMLDRFSALGMVTDFNPICAVGPNAGNPHYEPTEAASAEIKRGQGMILDLWAKPNQPKAVMADITWAAFTGEKPPREYVEQFGLLCAARDAAVDFVADNWDKGPIYGYQVDDACRGVIARAGLERYFIHRTGHSIAEETHGPGPNIDNLETEDRRQLLPGHLFSVEPGLYFETHGFRTEIDVLITPSGPEVTTQPVQQELTLLG